MLAICEIAGNQYLISKGDRIKTEKIDAEKGASLQMEKVLLVSENDQTEIGQPYIAGYTVHCEVLEQGRGEKIRVFKMKAKKRYQRTQGHRQAYSELLIKEIVKTAPAMKIKAEAQPKITSLPTIDTAAPQTLPFSEMPLSESKPKRKRSVKKAEETLGETVKPKVPKKRAVKTPIEASQA